MGVLLTVTMGMIARVTVRVGMAGDMGMGVHRCQVYSTSLPARVHLEVSSCYWKL